MQQPTIPPNLENALRRTSAPRILLIRHSDRGPIRDGDSGENVPLTPTGVSKARALGPWLAQEQLWAYSSPLKRCMDTARYIGVEPQSSNWLGAPGPFIIDRDRGAEVFAQYGTPTVIRAQIAGECWGCMRSLAQGVSNLLAYLSNLLHTHAGTGLAISHDTIVMPVIAWITGERFAKTWLAPLDGVILTHQGLVWQDQLFEVPQ